MPRSIIAVFAALSIAIAGCAFKGGSTYKPNETGSVMQVKRVNVVSSRKVVIEGLKDDQSVGWGTLVGATVAGAATYGLTKADTPLGVAVTIIAAIGGAMVGTIVEERKNRHPGAEYILQTETGKPFALVQALGSDDKVLGKGRRAVVLYGRGGFVRVVPEN
jgi:outer membrane lipoprotein SlyB